MRIRFDNAVLYDGTGDKPGIVSVVIAGDSIEAICSGPDKPAADLIIDLEGKALCPGFIDTHSHSDLVILETPILDAKIRQGITTEILGQDGIAMAPLPAEHIAQWRKNLAGLAGTSDSISWDYRDTKGYLDLLEKSGSAQNLCYLVPHGNLRMEVLGLDQRPATDEELDAMRRVTQRELNNGAHGISTGLIYPPCTYADFRELVAICQVAADNSVPLVIHQRSEADAIIESMSEVLEIARVTGVHIHFSHFKICGTYNDAKLPGVIDLLDRASEEGLRVTFDQYPYTAGSTMLSAILPPWAHAGGTAQLLNRLADRECRKRMLDDIRTTPSSWDNFVAFAGVDGISITNVQTAQNTQFIGKSLLEIGEERGTDPVEAALDLILEEENGVSMVDFYGLEKHVRRFMLRPEMNLCTDGLMHGTPHPRTYGAFPRFLGKYARDEQLMPLEKAIRKMTLQAAESFNIAKRGKVAEGWFADLVVFDPAAISDLATYTNPCQHPAGIELVMINGTIAYTAEPYKTVLCGHNQDMQCGKVLRLNS
ncbi:N-acyl-D-amino-acid deacylase family protein [Desulfosediminicola ganghwensis]|uniref:N-acyl-D-amino-acid deacylase family protein n=1 Tax=Desulfosediminicola ganghwensis TaxID=2569540 RepID=UPI0010AC3D67|nr:D-aminoacylase [Desulfosediminicola ganghwensis]